MGLPIVVGQNPQKVSGTAVRPYLLTNDSGSYNTVYLGQNSSVSTNSYALTLNPGASIVWTELNNEVWAVTDKGGSANLVVAYEAGGTFVPSSFGANATLISKTDIAFTTSQNVLTGTIADIYIGNYASVMVMVSTSITSATAFATDLSRSWTYADGVQYDSAYRGTNTTAFSRTNSAAWTFGNGDSQTIGLAASIQTYTFPVNNGFFAFNYGVIKDQTLAASSGAGTVTFRVYGLNTATSTEVYVNWTPIYNSIVRTGSTTGTFTNTKPVITTLPSQEIIVNTTTNGSYGVTYPGNATALSNTFTYSISVPTVTGNSNYSFGCTADRKSVV